MPRPKFEEKKQYLIRPKRFTGSQVHDAGNQPLDRSHRLRFTATSSEVNPATRKRFRKVSESLVPNKLETSEYDTEGAPLRAVPRASLSELVGTSVLELKATCDRETKFCPVFDLQLTNLEKWNSQCGYLRNGGDSGIIVLNPRQLPESGVHFLSTYCDNILVINPGSVL